MQVDARRIGFIGLGNIGAALAANLQHDGHALTVSDLDEARVKPLVDAGAAAAVTPADVARSSDVTFLSLPTPAVMEAVADDWLTGAAPGSVLVDLTTNAPATVRAVGARLAGAGAHLVEAPLTGGAPGARSRALVFIVGGEAEPVARVAPLLHSLGRATFHLGPLGCGNVGKLVNSLMAFTATWVSMEGLALGARHDIDLRTLVQMLRTAGASNFYIERMVEGINERGRPAEFTLELAAKDAALMIEVGRQVAVPLPVASAVHEMLVMAKALGLGEHDFSDFVEVMERTAAVSLHLPPAPGAPEV
jgi:3-hydroxyisobutyrate dehydrogenase-like beta-hydroxyacid dehydrogenase